MERYGPLRNLWEGGNQGEGILKYVKQEITMGLRPGWQYKLMRSMMKRKTLRSLMDTGWLENNTDDDSDYNEGVKEKFDTLSNSKTSYFEYKTEFAVQDDFENGVPLSGVWMSNGKGRIVLKNGKSLEINIVENTGRNVQGLWYHQWNLVDGVVDSDKTSGVVPCLFLQECTSDEEEDGINEYTLIRKDWKMIGENGEFERFGNI
jgi:hypothetical protein